MGYFQKLICFTALFFCISAKVSLAQIINSTVISKLGKTLGNDGSLCASLSGDGRFTAFESHASNLVSNDTNNRSDLFLYDSLDQSITRLSLSTNGLEQTGGSTISTCSSNISRDGSTIVYASEGIGLTSGADTNISRIYAIDRISGSVELLTPGPLDEGAYFPSVNEDGTKIVFVSNDKNLNPNANGKFQVYLVERPSNNITLISSNTEGLPSNGQSIRAEISHDGKWAVYATTSSDLKGATLPTTTELYQIFLVDLETGEHRLISKNSQGLPGNGDSTGADISADGNQIIFFTTANDLIESDTNKQSDVLLFDRNTNAFELISVNSDGKRIKGFHEVLGNALSADGNLIMFRALIGSFDKFRIEVYVRDRKNSQTYLSSFSNRCSFGSIGGSSHSGSIAPDTSTLAFAIGEDTVKSPLQLTLVGLDTLKVISNAPQSIDPIDADICGTSATLALSPFKLVVPEGTIMARARANSGVTYETQITNKSGSISRVDKLTSKKNILALKDLKPGNYSVKYRVTVSQPGSKPSKSKFSKTTKFTVKPNNDGR